MDIKLSDHFDIKRIFKFTLSPILMMVFTSLYGIVDGFFVSNYASDSAYAGVNVIMPVIMVIGGIGFMFGTGGSALTSMYLGQKDQEKANKSFTVIFKMILIVGIIFSLIGFIFTEPIAIWLGSIGTNTEGMVEEAIKYGRILSLSQVFFMLQTSFQSYLVVDEKPKLGFSATLWAGLANMILDALFIGVFRWGSIGAAVATMIGQIIGGLIPLIHFLRGKNCVIKFVKTKLDFKMIGQACFNGSSEFVNNISSSIVGFVYNIQLLKYYDAAGVSAYGTIMYVSFIFISIYIGYAIGMAPVIGYNYGANNKKEMKNVLLKSLGIISIFSVVMLLASEFLGPLFSMAYMHDYPDVLEITIKAFKIYSFVFLICGFNIYISSFFTALNNGLISAILSFLRTLVFQVGFLILLPLVIGKEGIWWCSLLSDICALILSFIFLFANAKKYGYFDKEEFKNV